MNIIIYCVYSRAAFISLDVVLWGGVYSKAAFNRVNAVSLVKHGSLYLHYIYSTLHYTSLQIF